MKPVLHEDFRKLLGSTFARIEKLSDLKGGEYSGDTNRLENFQRNARALGLQQETVWAVYAAKHWDAIMQYIQDIHTAHDRVRMEPISDRVDDLILYLFLFKAMLPE